MKLFYKSFTFYMKLANHHFKEKKPTVHVYILHSFRVLPGRDIRIGFGYKRHICLERVSIM